VVGNLQQYTQFEVANSIPDAAKNPGGLGAMGAGLGFGVGIAGQMAGSMNAQAVPSAPPPLPGKTSYFLALDGQQAGPFDLTALAEQISAGKLTRETLAWKNGMGQWTPAGLVTELAGLFANVPPAMPK
jgi:membrane protease subunit (stomatin/prohibitin family)